MRFDVVLPGGIDCWVIRAAGLDADGWADLSIASACGKAKPPATLELAYLRSESPVIARVTILNFGQSERIDRRLDAAGRIVVKRGARPSSGTRVRVEIDDDKVGRAIRKRLQHYSYDNDGEGVWRREHCAVWDEIQTILKRDGTTYDRLMGGDALLTRRGIEALIGLWKRTDPVRRDNIHCLFTPRTVPKADHGFVAAWLLKQFETDWKTDDEVGTRIWDLAVPEIADDLIRVIGDERYSHHRGPLLLALAKTKDARAADVIASVLEQEGLTRCALEALAKLRGAARHGAKIQLYLRHPDADVRREAKKTLKKLGFPLEFPPSPVHLVTGGRVIPKGMKEWSQNLDMDELRPTLERLSKCVDGGFGASDVAEVIAVAEEMKPNQTRSFRFPVVAGGKKTALWLVVFMDDVDAPDLRVHADAGVVRKLDALSPALD